RLDLQERTRLRSSTIEVAVASRPASVWAREAPAPFLSLPLGAHRLGAHRILLRLFVHALAPSTSLCAWGGGARALLTLLLGPSRCAVCRASPSGAHRR